MADIALTVSRLNEYVRLVLASDPMLKNIMVTGEISGLKKQISGHIYFSLKDENARVACVMFRSAAYGLDFKPEDGQKVTITGSVGLYTATGSYQIYVNSMTKSGRGDLFAKFEMLKKRLETEGLFDAALKKPLPLLPKTVGVATSPTGAAIRDIIRVLKARNPGVNILIAPCAVQGSGAAAEIISAIDLLERDGRSDVILVGRGGGSIEDLWEFNSEELVRRIYARKKPIVSCVGHETDFTLCDFAADIRAATPSNGAELATADAAELSDALGQLKKRLLNAMSSAQMHRRLRLEALGRAYVFTNPQKTITGDRRAALKALKVKADRQLAIMQNKRRLKLEGLSRSLGALNPGNVLNRGYAYISDEMGIIASAALLKQNQAVNITMKDGSANAVINNTTVNTDTEEDI